MCCRPTGGRGGPIRLKRTRVYEVESGQPVGPFLPAPGLLKDAAVAPDGRTVAVTGVRQTGQTVEGQLVFYDVRSGSPRAEPIALPAEPWRVALRRDGSMLAVICADEHVLLFDAATYRLRWSARHRSAEKAP